MLGNALGTLQMES